MRRGHRCRESARTVTSSCWTRAIRWRSRTRLVTARFSNGHRLLHHHRGAFWLAQSNHYALAANETIRTAAWIVHGEREAHRQKAIGAVQAE